MTQFRIDTSKGHRCGNPHCRGLSVNEWAYGTENATIARLRELRDLPARIPELRRQAVAELLAQGWSRRQIATELGISRQSVYEWGK